MIVVCGEALVDLVPAPAGSGHLVRPGGSPANVATGLGRLEVPVGLVTRLSGDPFGQRIRSHLVESRVDLSWVTDAAEPTIVALTSIDPDGGADYTFAMSGCADDGWRTWALPGVPAQTVAIHVSGSLALALPGMGDAIEAWLHRERGTRLVTFDPNPRRALTPELPALVARWERWLGHTDMVKASVEDLAWTFPGQRPEDLARRWRAGGCALVVITRGPDGVFALGAHGTTELPASPADVVDTVGAGDAFTAGLLAFLYHGGGLSRDGLARLGRADLDDCLRYAQRAAAITCGRAGADLPWRHDLPP